MSEQRDGEQSASRIERKISRRRFVGGVAVGAVGAWGLSHGLARFGHDPSRPPDLYEYFLDNFVITTSAMFWDPVLELSLKVLGPDRIMFGVDYPFAPNEVGTKWLDAAPITDTEKSKIYSGNARRVFHLG